MNHGFPSCCLCMLGEMVSLARSIMLVLSGWTVPSRPKSGFPVSQTINHLLTTILAASSPMVSWPLAKFCLPLSQKCLFHLYCLFIILFFILSQTLELSTESELTKEVAFCFLFTIMHATFYPKATKVYYGHANNGSELPTLAPPLPFCSRLCQQLLQPLHVEGS